MAPTASPVGWCSPPRWKKPKFKDMPFDMKRMLVGGFKVVAGQKF